MEMSLSVETQSNSEFIVGSESQLPCSRTDSVGDNHNSDQARFDIAKSLSDIFGGLSEGKDSQLHSAAREGNSEKIRSMLTGKLAKRRFVAGINPSLMPYSFLQDKMKGEEICEDSRDIAMKQLNIRNRLGATPLWIAAAAGHSKAVDVLCEYGAELEIADIKGQTPIFAAAKYNNIACVKSLLEAGANPDGCTRNISTPIYIAARENYPHVVALLIKHGADVNGRFGEHDEVADSRIAFIGSVPLYMTIVYQNFECFRQLILSGAELNAISNDRGFGTSLVTGVLRHQCDVRYLELIAICGGIRRCDRKEIEETIGVFRQFTHGLASTRKECLEFLDRWNAQPLLLTQLCRISIRDHLGPKRLRNFTSLHLPRSIHNYITLSHLYPDCD